MLKTHFKRQGSAGLLKLKGDIKEYHVEYDHLFGYLKIEKYNQMPKEYKGRIYQETHSKVLLYKNYVRTESPIENFQDIQTEINKITNLNITIESYIESYAIGFKKGDRDILNNIDITNYTVSQVLKECKINLMEFFKPWRVEENEIIKNILTKLSSNLLNQKFSDLYTFIHWYGIKSHEKFEQKFIKAIITEQ